MRAPREMNEASTPVVELKEEGNREGMEKWLESRPFLQALITHSIASYNVYDSIKARER